jgi:hypothetical protein
METRIDSNAICGRHEDLVTYLYGESTGEERRSFELHLEQCTSCSGELKGFGRVRDSLGAWNLNFESSVPTVNIEIRRNPIESLRDLLQALSSLPNWIKLAGGAALATTGLLVAFAIAGTRIDLNQGTISFGASEPTIASPSSSSEVGVRPATLTKAEIEKIIAERVAAATAEDRRKQEELSVRVSSLSAQLASVSQSRGKVAAELASLRAEQRMLAARGQATLGEWLFAANGSREALGGNDERDN